MSVIATGRPRTARPAHLPLMKPTIEKMLEKFIFRHHPVRTEMGLLRIAGILDTFDDIIHHVIKLDVMVFLIRQYLANLKVRRLPNNAVPSALRPISPPM